LLANDSDPDSDPLIVLSVISTSTNGGTVVLSSGNVLYTPVSGFSGLDAFSYTISDGRGGTASANVIVFVSDAPLPAQNALSVRKTANGFLVHFAGVPGSSYQILRALEVAGPYDTIVSTQTAPVYGIISYEDLTAPANRAFYRAALVP
jgi:hypothetical protein